MSSGFKVFPVVLILAFSGLASADATTTTTAKPTTTTTAARTSATGAISIVNDVALDDYVKGIAEVPSTWPMEALKAQAVAARTYALHQLGNGRPLPPHTRRQSAR